jgi:hypothetical protein
MKLYGKGKGLDKKRCTLNWIDKNIVLHSLPQRQAWKRLTLISISRLKRKKGCGGYESVCICHIGHKRDAWQINMCKTVGEPFVLSTGKM